MKIFRHKYFWLLLLLSLLNLLVMHYTLISTCEVENELLPIDYVDNLGFVTIEVIWIVSFFFFLFWGRIRQAALFTWIVTALWAFCNIVYSRYFFQYIPLSAFAESDGLADPIVIRSLVNGFHVEDLYFLVSLLFAVMLYKKIPVTRLRLTSLKYTAVGIVAVILSGMVMHWVLNPTFSPRVYFGVMNYELFRTWRYTCRPLYTNFQRGTLRSLSYAAYVTLAGSTKLSEDQEHTLVTEINSLKSKQQSDHHLPEGVKNVIVVLVESYMSLSVDLKVNGEEVTPFLNSLAHDPNIYYNGHMTSNITCGESSTGSLSI